MFRFLILAFFISATLAKPQMPPPMAPWNGMGNMLPPIMPGFGMIPNLPGFGGAIGSQIGVCDLINKLARGEITNVSQLMMIASQMNPASLAQGCQTQQITTSRPMTSTWRTSLPQSTQRSTTWGSPGITDTKKKNTPTSFPSTSTMRYYSDNYDY